jgi:hypothetical protein
MMGEALPSLKEIAKSDTIFLSIAAALPLQVFSLFWGIIVRL